MSEVEQARDHLRLMQHNLYQNRRFGNECFERYEKDRVLAALSWLWDAQERAGLNRRTLHMRLSPEQQEVALFSWPPLYLETPEQHRKRAFATYAHQYIQAKQEGLLWRLMTKSRN
jgi:hypothetical protein